MLPVRIAVLAFLCVALYGCANPIVFIPDNIAEQGLLVGRISAPDHPDLLHGDPVIGGAKYAAGIRDGYLVVPLEPGEYTLSSINVFMGSNSISTPYTSHTTTYSRRFPISQKLSIERGKATSLGLLVFLSSGESGSTRYSVLPIDNRPEMVTFLQETHPALYGSLKDKSLKAGGDFLEPARISELRRVFAARSLRAREPSARGGYVAGPAGTLAKLATDSAGRVTGFTVLETDTFVDLSRCSIGAARAACMKSHRQYLLARGDRVSTETLPEGVMGNSIHVHENGLLLIDNALNIYNSTDDGRSWKKHGEFAWAEPLGYESYRPDQKNRFAMLAGARGHYIYAPTLDADEAPLIHFDAKAGKLTNLKLPDSADRVETLYETDDGLFVGPVHTEFANGKVHFLPKGGASWQVREAPEAGCHQFAMTPDDREIQILCKKENVWKSGDGGVSWRRSFKTDSLFK